MTAKNSKTTNPTVLDRALIQTELHFLLDGFGLKTTLRIMAAMVGSSLLPILLTFDTNVKDARVTEVPEINDMQGTNRILKLFVIFKRPAFVIALTTVLLQAFCNITSLLLVTIGEETWSVYRRYRKFRELHNAMKKMYAEIGELDFPNRRFFGNRAEEFVRARRAQLE
ncbi:hypothetical protein QZH41_007833, partial [Actinostola sp. cb2023]